MLLAGLQMKIVGSDLASGLWRSLNLWGSKVHCHAVTFGLAPSFPPDPPPVLDASKATVEGVGACAPHGDYSQRAAPTQGAGLMGIGGWHCEEWAQHLPFPLQTRGLGLGRCLPPPSDWLRLLQDEAKGYLLRKHGPAQDLGTFRPRGRLAQGELCAHTSV